MRSSLIGSLVEVLRVNLARKASRACASSSSARCSFATRPASPARSASPACASRSSSAASPSARPRRRSGASPSAASTSSTSRAISKRCSRRAVARFVPAPHPALHPGRSAAIEIDGERIGFIGELHPRWRQAYELPGNAIVFELDAEALQRRSVPTFAPLPKQQSAWRDIAVVVGRDVTHAALMDSVAAAGESAVREATLFDIFEPTQGAAGIAEGERSLAVRLELRDDERTLTDEQIERVVAGVVAALAARLGARLRQQ